ncbi:MAG: hypothetical protein J4F32_05965 [Dehalococcoidia bacterium]|nr:hypothetical protein [Dehalococcoidia bacterium]
MRSLPRGSRRALPAAIAAVAVAILAAPVGAHVDHPDAIDLFNGVSGPYALRVVATPYVGALEVTAVVASGGEADADGVGAVRVTMSARAADGSESVGPARAMANDLSRPDDYWAVLTPRQAGAWVVIVEADSALGATRLELPLTLRERGGGFPWAAVIAVMVVAGPMALSLGLARRRRRARALRKEKR